MMQEATQQVQQNPTLMLVIAGLASALTIIAKGLLDLLKKNYRQTASGDRRSTQTISLPDMIRFEELLRRIQGIENDLLGMHKRYHDLSNQMAMLITKVELILDNRIK